MKVVILCGGYGTRIRDVADDIPKPMIPIGSYPILWHIMKYYASFGFKEFILCLGYKNQIIKDFFINYEARTKDFTITLGQRDRIIFHTEHGEAEWRITLIDTGSNAMTGARVKRIQKYIGDDDNFMLTYGDGLGNVDLDKLITFHSIHKKIMTVTGVRPPGRFGEIRCNSDGLVSEFNEKPQTEGGRISGGFFVCRREIFNYLDDRETLVLEEEPMRNLVANKQMCIYEHDGFWQPMDTSREYQYLNSIYSKGNAPWAR